MEAVDWNYLAGALAHVLKKGGWVLIPIYVVAQVGWFFALERWLALRRLRSQPEAFWKNAPPGGEELRRYVREATPPGLFGTVMLQVAETTPANEKALANRARESLEENLPILQKHLGTIAVLAAAAPLLGLVGTISGMMATFDIITLYGAGNPVMMAGGISEALLTTEAGLVVAFPLILLHNFLRNRADEIENTCISGATRLVNLFARETIRS